MVTMSTLPILSVDFVVKILILHTVVSLGVQRYRRAGPHPRPKKGPPSVYVAVSSGRIGVGLLYS